MAWFQKKLSAFRQEAGMTYLVHLKFKEVQGPLCLGLWRQLPAPAQSFLLLSC
jgi:hypothetical protein